MVALLLPRADPPAVSRPTAFSAAGISLFFASSLAPLPTTFKAARSARITDNAGPNHTWRGSFSYFGILPRLSGFMVKLRSLLPLCVAAC